MIETKSGIGFLGLLQIAFIVLKLCGIITWSWIFVLIPLILEASIVILAIIIAIIAMIGNNIGEAW